MNYQTILPEAHKTSYTEYDVIDFMLSFQNKKLIGNSIRLEGDLQVLIGNSLPNTSPIYHEPLIGAHNYINSITTDFQNVGSMENFREYPRFVKMKADCTMINDDMLNSNQSCELRASTKFLTNNLMTPYSARGIGGTNRLPDFSIKPDFLLNNVSSPSGDVGISYTKTGTVKVSIRLERIYGSLYGIGMDNTVSYNIQNLRMSYFTKPDDGVKNQLIFNTKLNLKQSLQSGLANVSTKVPAIANSVSCSFIQQSHEYTPTYSNCETETVPLLDQVVFSFNDSTNQYITFPIEDRMEVLERYLDSMSNIGVNNVSLEKVEANQGFGVGLSFGENINLANQKFNIQLTSGITNTSPYVIYMYFHSLRVM